MLRYFPFFISLFVRLWDDFICLLVTNVKNGYPPKCVYFVLYYYRLLLQSTNLHSRADWLCFTLFVVHARLFYRFHTSLKPDADWRIYKVCMQYFLMLIHTGVGIVQWLERQTRDQKVMGSNPGGSGRRSFFSRVNILCWLLFWYPFHPRVTCKRSQSFCQKCRWQVTAKHTYTLPLCL